MGSPAVLDFDRLLAPIPGENPAGSDLRRETAADSTYRKIRDARNEARRAERYLWYKEGQDDYGQQVAPPDWRPVLTLSPKVLAENTKDLEIVALLTEALVRHNGFAGLRDGFRLARQLIELYWEHLYPQPDEDGLRARVAPLVALNGEEGEGLLIAPIARVSITGGRTEGPFSVTDYQQALELERIEDPEKRAQRAGQPGAVSKAKFDRAVAETPREAFQNTLDDITECLDEFEQLGRRLEEKCGGLYQSPPTSAIRAALHSCRDTVLAVARNLLVDAAAGAADGARPEQAEPTAPGSPAPRAPGQLRSREEAFGELLRVAEFFRQTEPHSPVSYALEQAVRWGRMSLPDLLDELVSDAAVRQQVCRLVGISSGAGASAAGE